MALRAQVLLAGGIALEGAGRWMGGPPRVAGAGGALHRPVNQPLSLAANLAPSCRPIEGGRQPRADCVATKSGRLAAIQL